MDSITCGNCGHVFPRQGSGTFPPGHWCVPKHPTVFPQPTQHQATPLQTRINEWETLTDQAMRDSNGSAHVTRVVIAGDALKLAYDQEVNQLVKDRNAFADQTKQLQVQLQEQAHTILVYQKRNHEA